MDDTLKFALTIVAGIGGWLAVHLFSMERDRKNKKRDLQTKYLIDAFQKIERNVHTQNQNKSEIETALADIQLFGEKAEVDLALKFMHDFSKKGTANFGDLLHLLRANLRQELGLSKPTSEMAYFRLTPVGTGKEKQSGENHS